MRGAAGERPFFFGDRLILPDQTIHDGSQIVANCLGEVYGILLRRLSVVTTVSVLIDRPENSTHDDQKYDEAHLSRSPSAAHPTTIVMFQGRELTDQPSRTRSRNTTANTGAI